MQLVEHNLTHVIALDAHNTTTRGFNLNKAYERIQKEFGTNVMHGLKGAPALLISGQSIVKYEANRIQRKSCLEFFNWREDCDWRKLIIGNKLIGLELYHFK